MNDNSTDDHKEELFLVFMLRYIFINLTLIKQTMDWGQAQLGSARGGGGGDVEDNPERKFIRTFSQSQQTEVEDNASFTWMLGCLDLVL